MLHYMNEKRREKPEGDSWAECSAVINLTWIAAECIEYQIKDYGAAMGDNRNRVHLTPKTLKFMLVIARLL